MQTSIKKITSRAIVVLCVTWAGGLNAADPLDDTKALGGGAITHETKTSEGQPAKFNKASGIIGMVVRNQNDERLGEINDIVFDLNSERVAYAVLRVGSLLGREKLLAVPLNALTASADNKHLVLLAEKSKLDSAVGFDRNNWPSVKNPSWGAEPFWDKVADEPAVKDKLNKGLDSIPNPENPKPENKY